MTDETKTSETASEAQDASEEEAQDEASSESDGEAQGGGSQDGKEKSNVLEWIVGLIGALIVGGTLTFLVYEIAAGVGEPPDIRVTLGAPERRNEETIIPVEIENVGGSVAAAVIVEICAPEQGCAQITFDFVPHQSKRHGNVGFRLPPAGPLTRRVVSYREP